MPTAVPRRVLAFVGALALGVAGTLVASPALAVPTVDPVPLTPIANTVTNDSTPHFRWSEGTSDHPLTLRYRTEILNAQGSWFWGMAAIFNDEWTSERTLPDGHYSWRVRGVDRLLSEGPWSASIPFVVDTRAPVVSITSPAPGALVNASGVTVAGTVTDANPSRVELRDNGSLVATDSSGAAGFSFAYVPPSGTRTLTVTAIDAAGNSDAASSASVTVTVDSDGPTGVVSYGNTAPINGNVMAYLTPSESVTVTTPGWEDLGDGRWRKKFTKNALTPNYDEPVTFVDAFGNPGSAQVYIDWIDTVAPTAQVTYSTTSPTNGNIFAYLTPSEPITVLSSNWEARSDGTFRKAYPKNDKSPNWDQIVDFVDAAGNPGSAHVYIDWIDIVAPAAPQPINPQNGAMKSDPAPVLDWVAVADAVSYEVRVAQSPGRTPNENNGQLSGPTATTYPAATDSYALSGLGEGWHWWQVRAIDAAGNVGPWSNIWATGVDTVEPTVTLLTPTDGATLSSHDFSLTWESTESGVSYDVQSSADPAVDGDGALTTLIDTVTGHTPAFLDLVGVPDGDYYWQVRATDAAGNVGPWTAPFLVTVDADVDVQLPTGSVGAPAGPGATTTAPQLTTFGLTDPEGDGPEEGSEKEEGSEEDGTESNEPTADESADPETAGATTPDGFDAALLWLLAAILLAVALFVFLLFRWLRRRAS